MTTPDSTPHNLDAQRLHDILALQKYAYQRYPLPTAKERIDRLARLKRVLVKYQDQFAEAINEDYGNRSMGETKIGELLTCLEHIKYYSKNLSGWMKPSKRHVGIIHQPAKAWVQYQPLGVVGIIAPWNCPVPRRSVRHSRVYQPQSARQHRPYHLMDAPARAIYRPALKSPAPDFRLPPPSRFYRHWSNR